MGWKQWTRERLTAADLQTYIQDQVVMKFASAAARTAALPAPSEGMMSTLDDTEAVERYTNGGWRPLSRATCYGKMWRTAGLSAAALTDGSQNVVGMDAARVAGGVTFSTAAESLTLPVDGLWRLVINGHSAGSAAYQASYFATRTRASVADLDVATTAGWKGGANDLIISGEDTIPLKANDVLKLRAQHVGSAAAFYYGGAEQGSCSLLAEWVGPLPSGVTPL